MPYTDDPVEDFARHDAEQYQLLRAQPVCSDCDEPVQADHYYDINDEVICPDCMEGNYRRESEDFFA